MACSHSEDCDGRAAVCPITPDEVERVRVRVMTSVRIDLENRRLRKALDLAATRLGICLGRMRACHEQTRMHALLDEVEMFVDEARASLVEATP